MTSKSALKVGILTSCLIILLGLAATVKAGLDNGELLGKIADSDGRAVAKVEIVLGGAEEPLILHSNSKGRFHFRDLTPGNYSLEATLKGYSKAIYRPVNIRLGRTTTVNVQMSPLAAETIVVTSEPAVPTGPEATSVTVFSSDELDEIPLANDPWAPLAQTPGMLTAGHSSAGGRVSTWGQAGTDPRQSAFSIDGTVVGEMADIVPLPTVELEQAAEVRIVTGGTDVRNEMAGTLFHLVTRRGYNETRGTVRTVFADRDWQASSPLDVAAGDDLSGSKATRLLGHSELGGDLGGRLMRDHLWAWGSYGSQEIRRQAVGGLQESARLDLVASKIHSQFTKHSTMLSYYRGDRSLDGLGAGPDRNAEATLREAEPNELFKVEESYLPSNRLLIVGRYSALDRDVLRAPVGGLENEIVLGEDGIWQGTYADFRETQQADTWETEATAHHSRGRVEQEIQFGASYRGTRSEDAERWGNDSVVHLAGENFGTPFDLVRILRPSELRVEQSTAAVWLQDSLKIGSLTVNFGFRHETQHGRNLAGRVEGNPLFPELLPAIDYGGGGAAFNWNSVSPRLGLAYAFGESGRTVLRASYASFVSRLQPDLISRVNPLAPSAVTFGFEDRDQDQRFGIDDPHFVVDQHGVDLRRVEASVAGSPNVTDPVLSPENSDELRLSLERHLTPDMQLGIEYTERQLTNILDLRRLLRDETGRERQAHASDYVLDSIYSGLLPDGEPFAAPVYALRPGLELTGGSLLINGDRAQKYEAVTLRFDRRMANRFMLRGYVTWNDWRWQVGRLFNTFDDPTDTAARRSADAGVQLGDNNGDIVASQATDQSGRLFLNSRWTFNVSSLVQVAPNQRWGFQWAANLHGREGYPIPYTVAAVTSDSLMRSVQVTPNSDTFRLEDVYTLDLRLEKDIHLGGMRAAVSLDAFNALNAGYVLERERQLNSPQANTVRQALSPRVFRLGVRLGLR